MRPLLERRLFRRIAGIVSRPCSQHDCQWSVRVAAADSKPFKLPDDAPVVDWLLVWLCPVSSAALHVRA